MRAPDTRAIRIAAAALLAALVLCSCEAFPPTPSNQQILEAIVASNNAQAEPLELVFEEMEVPQRFFGGAGAVLWVADESIQRNYRIAYDAETQTFYVESYTTLWLGEDRVYRRRDEP